MSDYLPASITDITSAIDPRDPEDRLRYRIRETYIVLLALCVLVIIGFVVVPIGGAVVASGQVGVESRVKRIAHPTGGIVAELLVKNGDHVREGQVLVRLDNAVSGMTNTLSGLTVVQMQAQRARLDAERMGFAAIRFPADLLKSTDPAARQAMLDETRLFVTRNAQSGQMIAQLRARVAQYQKQIVGYQAQIDALRKQQELIAPEREGVRELWDKGLVTINRMNQLERTSADMDGSIANLQAQIATVQARIAETQEQIISQGATRKADAGSQFATVSNTINDQQMKSVSAAETEKRSVIRAPYSGVVDKLQLTTAGDVVKPTDTIMEIVPDKDKLIVEAIVQPNDIDQLRVGQAARIRFTAFNSTATPEIHGRLIFVAAERTANPDTKQSYFEVRIAIDVQDLKKRPDMVLKPGMPAEVYIETGSRSMMSYLLKPLRDQFARAFRDN